jgi:predicted anti-sigma-YlaC factor YlaD
MGLATRCTRARQAFSLSLDREASSADERLAASHISRCMYCRAFALEVSAITSRIRAKDSTSPMHRDKSLVPKGNSEQANEYAACS